MMTKKMKLMSFVVFLFLVGSLSASYAQVGRLDDGKWNDDPVYQGNVVNYNDRHIWVDIQVENLGFDKVVGILWSDNGWYSANWAPAVYEYTFADGSEKWGVDVSPVGTFMWHRSSAHKWIELNGYEQAIGTDGKYIEYAIYYYDPYSGITYWDNNNGQDYAIWVKEPGGSWE